jgi:hypothetical protein
MIVAVSVLRVAGGGGRGPFFNSTDLDRPTELTHRSAAVVVSISISILILMVMALADHDAVVSMPVSLTAANSQVTNSDMDVFSDDDWFISGVHRTR